MTVFVRRHMFCFLRDKGTIEDSGLGPLSWWDEEPEAEVQDVEMS
jgi:hypothetical protein